MAEINLNKLTPMELHEIVPVETLVDEIAKSFGLDEAVPSDPLGQAVLGVAVQANKAQHTINEEMKQSTLAYAMGKKLDLIGETYYRNSDGSQIKRKPGESCEDYRKRLQFSPRGLTCAGTPDSYNHNASQAHELLNLDRLYSHSPEPMVMHTYFMVLPEDLGEDENLKEKRAEVKEAIEHRIARFVPSDEYHVKAAKPKSGTITGKVICEFGVGLSLIEEQGMKRLKEYLSQSMRIHGLITLDGIHAALRVAGVHQILISDWVDIQTDHSRYPVIDTINLEYSSL